MNLVKINIKEIETCNYEYLIKNDEDIVIGRATTIDKQDMNKFCMLRLKIYKEENYIHIEEILIKFCKNLLLSNQFAKINILVDENIPIDAFIKVGFYLEGLITNSIISENKKDEMNFGIDMESFHSEERIINIVKLQGERIALKILTPENALELHNFYIENGEYLKEFEPKRSSSFYTLDAQRRLLIESYKEYLNGESANFGIYIEKKFIGKIKISSIVRGVFRSATIGYSISENKQNKGYMTEALSLVLKYAKEDLELHRVEASTLEDNFKSQKVLIKNGFKTLGINEKYLKINGVWKDHVTLYKILE